MIDFQIKNSVSQAIWKEEIPLLNNIDTCRITEKIIDNHNIHIALAKHLARIGISSENYDEFINPLIKNLLPDPLIMKDAEKAINIICEIISKKKPIGIFGDYDVDGACSAALFKLILSKFDVPVFCYIPDRFKEGYGPNIEALNKLKSQNVELIITVDCGILAHSPLNLAAKQKMKIIVIDHHKASVELPKVEAVVNPNRLDDDSSLGHLCATGLCFIILAGILRECKRRKISTKDSKEINLIYFLDLVALATVCDIVPLLGINRAFVKQGLKVLSKRKNLGLKALCDVGKLNQQPTTHSLGYIIGPRINAGGRLGNSDIGVKLLSENDEEVANGLALKLDDLNSNRKNIEKDVLLNAEELAYSKIGENPNLPLLVLTGKNWHEGVIGIVAGRIKDKFNKPTIVITLNDKKIGKGSGRGVNNFSLGDNIILAKQLGLIISGGGHDMAIGLQIEEKKINQFEQFMIDKAKTTINKETKTYFVTDYISIASCNDQFIDNLERIGPFGSGHSELRFVINNCRIKYHKWIGKENQHFSATINDGSGKDLKVIAFSISGTKIGTYLKNSDFDTPISILGRFQKNNFGGRSSIQLLVDDIAY